MKIFILGNGFDLSCGWKSRFSDYFQDEYEKTDYSNNKNFQEWFNEILDDVKKYFKKEKFFFCLFSYLVEPFLSHKEWKKPWPEDIKQFINSDTIFQIFCLMFEISNSLSNDNDNKFEIEKLNWFDVENDLKYFSTLNNNNELSLHKVLISKIVLSIESMMTYLEKCGNKNCQCYDNCEWLLRDFFGNELFKNNLKNLLINWISEYQENFNVFLWNQQQRPNSVVSYPNLSYRQAQKYNNLFEYVDNIKDGETIKIVNFNYTYQYFHKSIADDKNQILINNLLEKKENYITHNKHLNFLPISYIHGEAVGNRHNDNSIPRCIIGFNNLEPSNKSLVELTKSFKINSYRSHLNMNMFPDKYYQLDLPDLSENEHLDIVFFGHSLGENDWLYFKEIFNKYNLKNNANFKIYFLFNKQIFCNDKKQNEMHKKIKELFDWYLDIPSSDLWRSEYVHVLFCCV